MAFVEYGMTEEEFFNEPPYKFLVMQLHRHRQIERKWEHTRLLAASQYNASGNTKRRIKPKDIIYLDIDKKVNRIELDQETIDRVLEAWRPIKAEA